ncbi:MAG: methylated-DNA--[protein]-cysteine S-methyltransferase [Kofleriaceae bacterium]|nr:methylated-DNA--[protein]-cysteine S-methyltransferase [Kofleriaceae bacterium]
MMYQLDYLDSPVGQLAIVADEAGALRTVAFVERLSRDENWGAVTEVANPFGLTDRIRAYFAGELAAIDTLPVVFTGTEFQNLVWQALRTIPCGETWSYGDLARRIGRPRAVRAVGLANGANPIAIVVPCHRVIGSNGTLTGYGGGLDRKKWLLAHESKALSFDFG